MTDPARTPEPPSSTTRRRFLGYVIGGATLVVAADLGLARPSEAAIPSLPQVPELYDLEDLQTDAARPTANLITIVMHEDGTASFEMPRMEVGQGITTSTAMIIAEELDLPAGEGPGQPGPGPARAGLEPAHRRVEHDRVDLHAGAGRRGDRPARAARRGGDRARVAGRLLKSKDGVISAPDGSSVTYGELATKAASPTTKTVSVDLEARVLGLQGHRHAAEPHRRARGGHRPQAVHHGPRRPRRAADDGVPAADAQRLAEGGAQRRARCGRCPGSPTSRWSTPASPCGRRTFGQCIDAVRALRRGLEPGPGRGRVRRDHPRPAAQGRDPAGGAEGAAAHPERGRRLHLHVPQQRGAGAQLRDRRRPRGQGDRVVRSEVADRRPGRDRQGARPAEGRTSTVNVVTGGGSFGHKLFSDGAIEAAQDLQGDGQAGQADVAPRRRAAPGPDAPDVHLADPGHVPGRSGAHLRAAAHLGRHRLRPRPRRDDHRTTSTSCRPAWANLGFAETIFTLTQELPYNFGVVTQLLNETDQRFNTGSMRNIYSPDVAVRQRAGRRHARQEDAQGPAGLPARVPEERAGQGGAAARSPRSATGAARWPRGPPRASRSTREYKGATACWSRSTADPETVNRKIHHAVTGPRVTKAVIAIDVGLVDQPPGPGGADDGLASTTRSRSR